MQRTSFSDQACSVARALDIIGEWWTLMILRDIFYGVTRFEALFQQLGISRKVLTQRLTRLTDEGILRKSQYQAHPPRYEYRLTRKGQDLLPVLLAIMRWGDRWLTEDGKSVPVQFIHQDCGEVTKPVVVCSKCKEPLSLRNVRPIPGPGADSRLIESMREASIDPDLFHNKEN